MVALVGPPERWERMVDFEDVVDVVETTEDVAEDVVVRDVDVV